MELLQKYFLAWRKFALTDHDTQISEVIVTLFRFAEKK